MNTNKFEKIGGGNRIKTTKDLVPKRIEELKKRTLWNRKEEFNKNTITEIIKDQNKYSQEEIKKFILNGRFNTN